MTYIPVIVRVVDDVVPDAQVDIEYPDIFPKVTSCYNCGGLLFYQSISKVEGTEMARDIEIYCAVCGRHNGGRFDDPFDELDENMKPKEKIENVE